MKTNNCDFDNSWYNPGGNILKRSVWYIINVLLFQWHLNPSSRLKVAMLRRFGAKIGRGVVIKPGVNIKYPWHLSVGDYSWIGEDVWIDNLADVTIGANCCISQGSLLLCGNHNYKSSTFELIVKPIKIYDGAWVCAKSVVCPGVNVGENAVLTVGSIATSSLEPNGVYQGNPAILKRSRV
jgi:putative colanic acid biosynthesis acetyltransferase WcaF